MPQHAFRLFGNLIFLQSLDKERILSCFLAEHRLYFVLQGLDIDERKNDDACARRLLAIFTKPSERMPGDLLRDLYVLNQLCPQSAMSSISYVLNQLADEEGHERIVEEAERLKIELTSCR